MHIFTYVFDQIEELITVWRAIDLFLPLRRQVSTAV